jgi:maleylacetoacetate isomerase
LKLYHFFRNSAGFRVRIALNLKGLAYESVPVNIMPGRDAQNEPAYRKINPQGLIPTLVDGDAVIAQSGAIIEYLEEKWPAPPLLPKDLAQRAQVRAFAQAIACDIHPLNNTRVHVFLERDLELPGEKRIRWYRHWVARGFESLEQIAGNHGGPFAFGDAPTMADIFLVPQWDNARRFKCDLAPYPRLTSIVAACERLEAFAAASPERQPDFVAY